MHFFRGISVPYETVNQTIETIFKNGLTPRKREPKMDFLLPTRIHKLFSKDDLTLCDTRSSEEEPAVFACGELEGAAYYACKHNITKTNTAPIIIQFEADENNAVVDGRDFLYPAIQWGDAEKARPILKHAFGCAVLPYAEKAWKSESQQFRIALCDLAIQDPKVKKAHYDNDLVIGGRYGTIFRSAFVIRLPVNPKALINIWSPKDLDIIPDPDINFNDILLSIH